MDENRIEKEYEWCTDFVPIKTFLDYIDEEDARKDFILWCFNRNYGLGSSISCSGVYGDSFLREVIKAENAEWLKAMLELGYVREKKVVRYANIYKDRKGHFSVGTFDLYTTEEEAKNKIASGTYVKTIRIEI
jgi:hypothetical protein